jgi:SAM-dependent methyltransferase
VPADPYVYASERVARAYAGARPAIHPLVWQRVARLLQRAQPWQRALDIGCGGGASTAALLPHARELIGVDIFPGMLRLAAAALPQASFLLAGAQALPFPGGHFDLVSAAGSLNYTDVRASVAEAARVVAPGGHFVPFDFATGRRLRDDARLAERASEFRRRFPAPPGYGLDLRALPYADNQLERIAYEEFEVEIAMSGAGYVDYLLGDAGVEAAIVAGMPPGEARRWLESTFNSVFGVQRRGVLFDVQLAIAHKPA